MSKGQRLVAGCMSGTSMDGVDAALVCIEGAGPAMKARFVRGASAAFPAAMGDLRVMAQGGALTAASIASLAAELSGLHVVVLREALGADAVTLICAHGQTVFHAPPLSWQLFNPWPLVAAFGVPVVHDLRGLDLALGGQGAPLMPIADWVLFRAHRSTRIICNLGGFCSITILNGDDRGSISAMDVCICNQWLDAISRERLGVPMDLGGEIASHGRVHVDALESSLEGLRAMRGSPGRSLGTREERPQFLWSIPDGRDAAATACRAIAVCVCESVQAAGIAGAELVLCGGGARNAALVGAIKDAWAASGGRRVITTDELGIPLHYREAVGFAVLGALSADGEPISISGVTGARDVRVSGSWSGQNAN